MKTLISFTAFLLFLNTINISAQKTISIRAGINVANYDMSGDIISRFGNKPTVLMTFGMPIEIPLSSHFSIQPELSYIQKGYKFNILQIPKGSGDVVFSKEKNIHHLLEIPILAKYKMGIGQHFRAALMAGPSLGYVIKKGTTEDIIFTDFNGDIISKGLTNSKIDFALNFGSELSLKRFFLDARYQLGMTNMNSTYKTEIAKTRGWLLTMGYRLWIGGH